MSIGKIVITLIIGLIVFEVIEHILFPLFWLVKNRKKKSVCGREGLLGKVVEVRQWEKKEGRVFVNGELWNAISDLPLTEGDKAVIEDVNGLLLKVRHIAD